MECTHKKYKNNFYKASITLIIRMRKFQFLEIFLEANYNGDIIGILTNSVKNTTQLKILRKLKGREHLKRDQ